MKDEVNFSILSTYLFIVLFLCNGLSGDGFEIDSYSQLYKLFLIVCQSNYS